MARRSIPIEEKIEAQKELVSKAKERYEAEFDKLDEYSGWFYTSIPENGGQVDYLGTDYSHGTENIFQRILHILYAFGLVLVEDSLRQLSVWCCFFFCSCHSECVHPFF